LKLFRNEKGDYYPKGRGYKNPNNDIYNLAIDRLKRKMETISRISKRNTK